MSTTALTIGLLADAHCGRGVWHTRYFSDSPAKLAVCIDTFIERGVDMLVNLGDTIDRLEDDPNDPADYLAAASEIIQRFDGDRHTVLGNHDLACLTKDYLLGCAGRQGPAYYAFDKASIHFVVLDSNHFRDGSDHGPGHMPDDWADTWLGERQLAWLADTLAAVGDRPTIIFCHANLDYRESDGRRDPHVVCDHAAARTILESAANIRAIFQGHCHPGHLQTIAGIPAITLRAMCEGPGPDNNAFAIAHVNTDGSIAMETFGQQPTIEISPR